MATVVDIIFVGTGTSGAVPNVSCLTDPVPKCKVCLSAMTPEGRKNMKKNTSMIVRYRKHGDSPSDRLRTVLIDCGKTFYDSALHIFPRYGIRYLDAVILTHGHADACYGMDGLRQWTLGGAVQKSIDIYLSDETMEVVQRTFPFLVDVRHATGGGDVATFNYNIISPDSPFNIEGLEVMPLPVHHGKYLSTGEPYWCYGFKMGGISYISDTNYIPPETMKRILSGEPNLMFVIDCLRSMSLF
ncbi:beta-lactamase-like protein [Fennellomyces sp. T-0311]|nr:beta-lactamase-like protein [Fennellomyces sp. T-0311]